MRLPYDDVTDVLRPRVRRLVAVMRLFFAAVSLFAIWFDPAQPSTFPVLCYWLLVAYTLYSAILVGLRFSPVTTSGRLDDAFILIDVAVLSLVIFLTEGPTSPFFNWFNFILVSTVLTRGSRAAMMVSLLVTILYVFGSLLFLEIQGVSASFELHRFLIRAGYLSASGLMLAYYSLEAERINREVARVFGWLDGDGSGVSSPLEQALDHARALLDADCALLVWEDEETLRPQAASLDATGFSRGPTDEADVLDEEEDQLLAPGERAAGTAALPCASAGGAVLAYGIAADDLRGRLFISRARAFRHEEFRLGRLVAEQVASGLRRTTAIDALAEAAAAGDRIRVARDLHDGILQSLAGTALHLQAMLVDRPELDRDMRDRIARLQAMLLDEQRQLRAFIERLNPWHGVRRGAVRLAPQLGALSDQLGEGWRIKVSCSVQPSDLSLPEPLTVEIEQIVREAVANAVRHGGATRVSIEVARQGDRLALAIADDGRGLDRHGRFDAAAVHADALGSRSLAARIAEIGGSVALDSGPGGLHLAIHLPLSE